MGALKSYLKPIVYGFSAASFLIAAPAVMAAGEVSGSDRVPDLMQQLSSEDPVTAKKAQRELDLIWSRSGSPAMDLLLRQGRDALAAGDLAGAVGHLSALIDHAPDFAAARTMRAQAFFREDELGMAMSDLEHALALNPLDYEAAFGLCLVLEQLEQYDAAYKGYQSILAIYPTFDQAAEGLDRLEGRVSGRDI